MTPERWQRIEEMFQVAVELPEEERASALAREFAGDVEGWEGREGSRKDCGDH